MDQKWETSYAYFYMFSFNGWLTSYLQFLDVINRKKYYKPGGMGASRTFHYFVC